MSSSTKEAMDLDGSRRRATAPKAGSVWESRMKLDEVKGGFKVFNATHDDISQETNTTNPNTISTLTEDKKLNNNMVRPKQSPSGKRKTWKSESTEGSPVQIARQRSEMGKNSDEELSVPGDGPKKSPAHIKKTRSNPVQLWKLKSDPGEALNGRRNEGNSENVGDGNLKKSVSLDLVKAKIGVARKLVVDEEKIKNSDGDELKKDFDVGIEKSRSDEDCKEFGVCEEKAVVGNVGESKTPLNDDSVINGEEEEEEEEEIEKKSVGIKEISVEAKKIVIEEKKFLQNNETPLPFSPIVKKQSPPAINHARIHPAPTKTKRIPDYNFHGTPRTHSKLQSFVDLVMWKDVSKSAFVFGIGTFAIISSAYSKDLNISFISVISYLGLVYLAANFLFRSLINRGSIYMENRNQDYVVGEEEAIWVIRLVLPYINEFLLKLRALFSGDPATTMKLAVLLFILARCGSSITIWKMAKLGFFGVFTVPKVCSSYSTHLAAYGTFWIRRFRDAWESCSHKKAVGFAIFTLIWNLSSVVARIWAVFMLFVGFKYYQQSLMREGCIQQEATSSEVNVGGQRPAGRRSTPTEIRKQKKVC